MIATEPKKVHTIAIRPDQLWPTRRHHRCQPRRRLCPLGAAAAAAPPRVYRIRPRSAKERAGRADASARRIVRRRLLGQFAALAQSRCGTLAGGAGDGPRRSGQTAPVAPRAPSAPSRAARAATGPGVLAAQRGRGSSRLPQPAGQIPGVQLGGRQPVIHKVDLGDKGTYYRAMVGPLPVRGEASRAVQRALRPPAGSASSRGINSAKLDP